MRLDSIETYDEYLKNQNQHCSTTPYKPITSSEQKDTTLETQTPIIINFYGCSFNFAKNSTTESRYNNGDETYNHGE